MLETKQYRITLKHDNGVLRLALNAQSPEQAVKITMLVQDCSRRAVTKVEEKVNNKWIVCPDY